MHKAGKIVLVPFPFTDLSGSKVRPALIISNKIIGDDIVVCFISTNIKKKEKLGVFVKMDSINGLKSNSVIMVSKIATLEKKIILGEIGQLSEVHMRQVKGKIKDLFL
jgi:mRNA interferase MazF